MPARAAAARGTIGGSWGAYYWNGYIYSSELARGFDILELLPSDKLSANELAAAKLVRFTEYNPQSQPKIVWPAAFPVVRSYLDQLVRNNGLAAARTTAIGKALDAAEKQTGAARGKCADRAGGASRQGRERREGRRARSRDVGGDQASSRRRRSSGYRTSVRSNAGQRQAHIERCGFVVCVHIAQSSPE